MGLKSLLFLAMFSVLTLVSCGSKNESISTTADTTEEDDGPVLEITAIDTSVVNHDLRFQHKPTVVIDSSIDAKTKSKLDYDFANLQNMWIEAADNGSFAKIFNGTSQAAIINYLNTRLNYLVPPLSDSELGSRLITADIFERGPVSKGITMASNIGTLIWLSSIEKSNGPGTDVYSFRINGRPVSVDSSRTGIIMLGRGYSMNRSTTADRISTLIHESRHSDCTGGLSAVDRQLLKNGEPLENHSCGHIHVKCPPGHPLAGILACDEHRWGAYAIEWMFDLGMTKYCKNCTAEAKEIFRISEYDSKSRLLFDTDRMVRNSPPDMSSSNL